MQLNTKAILVVSDIIKHFYINEKERLDALGIKMSITPILHLILDHPNCTQQEISNIALLKKSTISEILKELENDGYIQRHLDSKDKRKMIVNLTKKGKNTALKIQSIFDQYIQDQLTNLTDEEMQQFMYLVEKIQNV